MRTYAIVNRKGGVGKTTTAVNLAYILATSCGKRVLLIDADSQGNATGTLLPRENDAAGLSDALRCSLEWYPDIISQTEIPGLHIIPANEDLGDFELECTIGLEKPNFNRFRSLIEVIAEDDEYDAVIVDCPPYYSVSCISALSACDSIIIPAGVDAYSTVGMAGLVRQIDNIRRACPQVKVAGCLVTQWHRSNVAEDAVATLREDSPIPIFKTAIRRTDKAIEASWAGQPVGQWSPFSSAARDYRAWVAELMELEGKRDG